MTLLALWLALGAAELALLTVQTAAARRAAASEDLLRERGQALREVAP